MNDAYDVMLTESDRLSLPLGVVEALRVRLGTRAESWLLHRLPKTIELCQSKWGLEVEKALPGASTAVVLAVRRAGAAAVLKVHPERESAEKELLGWQLWNGKGMPSLLEHDAELQVLLQERVTPAESLAEVNDPDIATRAATDLLGRLHAIEPLFTEPIITKSANYDLISKFPPLATLVSTRFTRAETFVHDNRTVVTRDLLNRAREVADRLLSENQPDSALHGDFFPDNILSSDSSGWVAIDPQPCRGEAAFDAGTWSYAYGRGSQLHSNAEVFAQRLNLSSERICSWALIVAATNLAGRAAYGHADQREIETTLAACRELL